jgi:hypothetical protein
MPINLAQSADLAPFALSPSSSPNLAACDTELVFAPGPSSPSTATCIVSRTPPLPLACRGASQHAIVTRPLASQPSTPLESAYFGKTADLVYSSNSKSYIVSPRQPLPLAVNISPPRTILVYDVAYSPLKPLLPSSLYLCLNSTSASANSIIRDFITAVWLIAVTWAAAASLYAAPTRLLHPFCSALPAEISNC